MVSFKFVESKIFTDEYLFQYQTYNKTLRSDAPMRVSTLQLSKEFNHQNWACFFDISIFLPFQWQFLVHVSSRCDSKSIWNQTFLLKKTRRTSSESIKMLPGSYVFRFNLFGIFSGSTTSMWKVLPPGS